MSKFFRVTLFLFVYSAAVTTYGQSCFDLNPSGVRFFGTASSTGTCSPVTQTIRYQFEFSTPTPATGTIQLLFSWGDGTPNTFFTVPNNVLGYDYAVPHDFPTNSDCEYLVQASLFVNGAVCTATNQQTLVSSFRTEAFNQGLVRLINPATGTNLFNVCEGTNLSAVFNDLTIFNCNESYIPTLKGSLITNPNSGRRWQQIVYNTQTTAGTRIPNVRVDGIQVTDATGAPMPGFGAPNFYQDPRGVFLMTPPVTATTPAKRNTLTITAPGGFGAGFPVAGNIFEVTIRYWNVCNPYDNPAIPGPPADPVNGATPPIQAVALVRIVGAPAAPTVNNPSVCESAAASSYNITASGSGQFTWYKDAALTQILQGPNTDNTFNPVTEGPTGDRINPAVTGSQTFNRYVTVRGGADNCTSPPATITIRIDDTNTPGTIAHPLGATPITICNADDPVSFTSTAAGTGGGPGGTISYQWQNATATGGPYTDITGATSDTFDPTTAQVNAGRFFRRRLRSGNCADVFSNVIEFRLNTPVTPGTISGTQTICASPGNPAIL
ncbi:MAG TPA: hypothetical protein DCE81_00980 [Cytophagales bacterium]|nr:hypothetical protein [Cytophagales bacterium]